MQSKSCTCAPGASTRSIFRNELPLIAAATLLALSLASGRSHAQSMTLQGTSAGEIAWSWAPNAIGAPAAQAKGAMGKGVVVAVIDTGVNASHQELVGRIDTARAWNAVTGRAGGLSDGNGHGTFVASEIVGNMDGKGMYGIAPLATVLPIQVFAAPTWSASDSTVASGVRYSTGKAFVVSMSLGAPGVQPSTASALQAGVKAGQLFAIAAGNSGLANPEWPARYAKESWANGQIIAVGAVDSNKQIASFSNRAGDTANWFICAPGVNVIGAYYASTNMYAYMSGTSMATPLVAGAAADLKGYWPQLTAAQVAAILFQTADHLGTSRVGTPDPVYGWGMLNLGRALQPVGTVMLPAPNGSKLPMTSVVQSTSSATAGVKAAAANGQLDIIGLDKYNRQFHYDAGASMTSTAALSTEQIFGSSDRLMRYSEQVLDAQGSRLAVASEDSVWAYKLGAMAEYDNRKVADHALVGAGLVKNYTDGSQLAFGTGGTNLFFGLQGVQSEDMPALTLSAFNNAFLALVPSSTSLGMGMPVAERVQLKFGFMTSAAADASYAQLGMSNASISANAALAEITREFDGGMLGLQIGQLRESGAWLGSTSGEAFAVGSDASTTVVTIESALRLGHGFAIAGYYSEGFTRGMSGASTSLVTQVTGVQSQAFGLGLIKVDSFGAGDRFSVSLSQPLRATSGSMNIAAPSDVTSGGAVVYDHRAIALGAPARELLSEVTYYTPVSRDAGVAVSYLARHNPGNTVGADENVVGVRYTLRF